MTYQRLSMVVVESQAGAVHVFVCCVRWMEGLCGVEPLSRQSILRRTESRRAPLHPAICLSKKQGRNRERSVKRKCRTISRTKASHLEAAMDVKNTPSYLGDIRLQTLRNLDISFLLGTVRHVNRSQALNV